MKKIALLLVIVFISVKAFAQYNLPYTFINSSYKEDGTLRYEDEDIYIGLVGKFGNNVDVWMDMSDYSLIPMSADQNTLDGPSWSTPADWKYPDIFTQLSNITDKTIQIPQGLYGCRIFISFESPMYLHFHDTGGYAGANLNNSTDPNDGIRWEIVELTWGDSGLWTNNSRVDAYQYALSVEVSGFTGGLTEPTYTESYLSAVGGNGTPKYGQIGEKLPHNEILDLWDIRTSSPYHVAKVVPVHSIDGEPIIEQPSKVEAFPTDILDDYIDEIWSTYTASNKLVINIGDRGTWEGWVTSGEQFDFIDPADGSIASFYWKPTSFNAIEGSGSLAFSDDPSADKRLEDLMIQAQIAAAITRHAIYTDEAAPTIQYTHDASRYFVHEPYNEYVSFFHNEDISYDSQTYAFAYDDVGDHSSTIQCTFPTSARVIIGGYDQYVPPAPALAFISIAPYVTEIEEDSSLQFTAQGYDQNSDPFTANVSWSTTGGTIDANGLFTATTVGDFIITAQDGGISRSVNITVTEIPGVTGCEADAPNGDFSYIASNDLENPTITFIPSAPGNGDALCVLYYNTDPNVTFPGYGVDPNIPHQINASEGETVYFYYTYSLASGGENTTFNSPQSFVVGGCDILSISENDLFLKNSVLYPNPIKKGQNVLLSNLNKNVSIDLYTINGKLLSSDSISNTDNLKLKTAHLSAGLYLVIVSTNDTQFSKTFKLMVN